MQIPFGGYVLDLEALAARIVLRWPLRIALGLVLLCGGGAIVTGVVPPVWRGPAQLTITAPTGATLTVNNRSWPQPVYAGAQLIRATWPDGRIAHVALDLARGGTATVALPTGRTVAIQPVPPPAPGMQIAHIWAAGDTWRVQSLPAQVAARTSADGLSSAPQPTLSPADLAAARQTIAVGPTRVERLGLLDAFGGLADRIGGVEVSWTPRLGAGQREPQGDLALRGWSTATTIPLSVTATLVRLSPDGQQILVGSATSANGTNLALIRATDPRPTLLAALPGTVRRVLWHPDGHGVAIISATGDGARLTLTLIRTDADPAAAVVADIAASTTTDALLPFLWDGDQARWIAPEPTPMLWTAPLTTLLPEATRPLDALALAPDADGYLLVARHDGQLTLDILADLAPATVPVTVATIPVPADAVRGALAGPTGLLLRSTTGAWIVRADVPPARAS